MSTEAELTLTVIRAIDAYICAQRKAAENFGRHWLFKSDERRIDEEYEHPVDAATAAFLAALDQQGWALVPKGTT
jgi:hypothetical protein